MFDWRKLLGLPPKRLPLSADNTKTLLMKRGILEQIHREAVKDKELPRRIAEVERQLAIVSAELSTRTDLPPAQTVKLKAAVMVGKPKSIG